MDRLMGFARACGARVVLTTAAIAKRAAGMLTGATDALRLLPTDTIDGDRTVWTGPMPSPTDVAFLQFTSGSTSSPKGVIVEHRNLSEHQRFTAHTQGIHDDSKLVSWLPAHHDMGLMGDLLMAVWTGCPLTQMSPGHFIERPMRWLEALSGVPAARSGAPNFGFALMTRKLDQGALAGMDLSGWETAHCGAEPVRRVVMERFARALAPAGFSPAALAPAYGLAEATVFVSDARPWVDGFDDPGSGELDGFVACGRVGAGPVELAIVDPDAKRVQAGIEGEIWVRGPTVAAGYWERPDATQETFHGALDQDDRGHWLRTGDLGRIVDGLLYVTGRAKDLIIWRGENIYPQDVEFVVEDGHAAIRPGCCAAFAVELPDGSEGLGVVAEVRGAVVDEPAALAAAAQEIRARIGAKLGVPVSVISLIGPRTLPKTTSGKVMRRATRAAIDDGTLPTLLRSSLPESEVAELGVPSDPEVMEVMVAWLAAATGLSPERIPSSISLDELGIESLRKVALRDRIKARFGVELSMEEFAANPSLAQLSSRISQPWARTPRSSIVVSPTRQDQASTSTSTRAVLPSLAWMGRR
jgi:acyl-CoA synthetase (AMP-forming)/AMP-acid ligase II/acyl carrier protein